MRQEYSDPSLREELSPERSSFPCSFSQQQVWMLERSGDGGSNRCIPAALRLSGELDVAVLERSFAEIVRRHQILRTGFSYVKGTLVQIVHEAGHLPLTVLDLSAVSADAQRARLETLAEEEAGRACDLEQGPLARAVLLRLGAKEHVLLVSLHRLIADEASHTVLARELEALYGALWSGRPSPLHELPLQYGEFARQQKLGLSGPKLDEHLRYWKRRLQGASPLQLPTDRPYSSRRQGPWSWQPLTLPGELSRALAGAGARQESRLTTTLLAAFLVLLHRYTREEDITLGVVLSRDGGADTEGLIGPLTSPFALRTGVSGALSFQALREQVQEQLVEALVHRELPFDALGDALHLGQDLDPSLLRVMVVIDDAPAPHALPGLTLTPLALREGTLGYDLTLRISIDPEGRMTGGLEYCSGLFHAATLSRMAEHFERVLGSLVGRPEQRVWEVSLLGEQERRLVVEEWNRTRTEYPRQASVHGEFERQVERTPEAVAVEFEGQALTYRELNRRANQLAHHLRKQGVRAGTPVGLSVERSLEMVVATLGILKAGGAYVPLEPSYPAERLAFMLEDTRVE
ncbi:condensation domain-containing protein, partial [Archangium sp.]|uniref:condensation domain-containing protein n=1 Tax=Archangium sp. TaxID=1872627 RepID=UPI002D411995